MSNQHNKWLAWKLKHGLATRGHAGSDQFHPKGLFAGLLYKLYFRKRDPSANGGPQTFTQNVGGVLGPVGKTNGE